MPPAVSLLNYTRKVLHFHGFFFPNWDFSHVLAAKFISRIRIVKNLDECRQTNVLYDCDDLKGQCHKIFCFWFFFPPAQEYPIRTVSNFFENSRTYKQVKVHHRYQRHRWQICHRCQRHRQQNCFWYQLHRRRILPPVSLVLFYRWKICHRCQCHRWQLMGTISGCWDLKVNLKAKMFL